MSRSVFSAISPVIVIIVLAAAQSGASVASQCARSQGGMVASACPEATAVGANVLEAGGNAVDAAIAMGFALSVSYPAAGNLGGGGFILMHLSSGATCFIDFREKAPAGSHRDMYLDGSGEVIGDLSIRGHLASGVPGTVAGLWKAYELHGSMEWADLVRPSVELAEKGFIVSSHLAASLQKLQGHLEEWPGLAKFFNKEGMPLEEGELLRQHELAATLKRIAANGPEDFYSGQTAHLIAEEMAGGGGLITIADLAAYEAVQRDPLRGSYRNLGIISAPPPSSGGIVLLEILNILEGYRMNGDRDIETFHRVVEAERRAYADRAKLLGDPDYLTIPVDRLISKAYADDLRNSIGPNATPSTELDAYDFDSQESEETTHYSIIDAEGNAVAITTTLNGSYGSYVVVEGAGFLMNNEMDDFSIKPGVPNMYGLIGGEANSIEPGKRMLSSMTPTIVINDGEPWLVLGTPGGSTIITTVAQVIMNIVDFGMEPLEAVATSRYHHQWSPDIVYYEEGTFTKDEENGMRGKGHKLKERSLIGDIQLIVVDGEELVGVSDPRRGGMSQGTGSGGNQKVQKEGALK